MTTNKKKRIDWEKEIQEIVWDVEGNRYPDGSSVNSTKAIEELVLVIKKACKEQKKEIGKEFKKWYKSEKYELVEDAIERITGIKI